MRRRLVGPAVVVAAVVVAAVVAAGCGDGDSGGGALEDRRDEVAERGEDVMPFDLDATTHRFEPVADGLVQTVVADDPGDAEQVRLVREHLAEEAGRFGRGDFGDPAAIHGHDMPGLAELEAGHERVEVVLAEVEAGARLTYTTADPALVDALHRWAEAQVMDHGAHAEAPAD